MLELDPAILGVESVVLLLLLIVSFGFREAWGEVNVAWPGPGVWWFQVMLSITVSRWVSGPGQ